MRPDPHGRNLRKNRIVAPGICYSVTTTVHDRTPRLESPAAQKLVVDELAGLRQAGKLSLHGFVVMPDHLHVLLSTGPDDLLPGVMKLLKGYTARQLNLLQDREGKVWQSGYYDHALRDPNEAFSALRYLHDNPVRAGLVSRPELFAGSSAHPNHSAIIDPIA